MTECPVFRHLLNRVSHRIMRIQFRLTVRLKYLLFFLSQLKNQQLHQTN